MLRESSLLRVVLFCLFCSSYNLNLNQKRGKHFLHFTEVSPFEWIQKESHDTFAEVLLALVPMWSFTSSFTWAGQLCAATETEASLVAHASSCMALHVKHNITHPPPGTWELHSTNQVAAQWFTVWGGDLHNSQLHILFSSSHSYKNK